MIRLVLLLFLSFAIATGVNAQHSFLPPQVKKEMLEAEDQELIDAYQELFEESNHPVDRLSLYYEFISKLQTEEHWQSFIQHFMQMTEDAIQSQTGEDLEQAKKYHALALNQEGYIADLLGDAKQAKAFYLKALKIYREIDEINEQGTIFNNIGYLFKERGDLDSALFYFRLAKQFHWQTGDRESYSLLLNNEAYIFDVMGDKLLALQQYDSARMIQETLESTDYLATTLSNLALLHGEFGDSLQEINMLKRSMNIDESNNNVLGTIQTNLSIGDHFLLHQRPDTAYRFYQAAKRAAERNELPVLSAYSYLGLAETFLKTASQDSTDYYLIKCLKIAKEQDLPQLMGLALVNQSIFLQQKNRLSRALNIANKAFEIGKKSKLELIQHKALEQLIKINEVKSNYKMAYTFKKRLDSLENHDEELKEQRSLLKSEFRREKLLMKENDSLEMALLEERNQKVLLKKEAELESSRWQRGLLGGGLALSIIASRFFYNAYRRKKKDRELIQAQKEEVSLQRDIARSSLKKAEESNLLLQIKNDEITESIEYAKRLQEAVLPPKKLVKEWLTSSFILYKPKDIVSGDFYWMENGEYEKEGVRGNLIFFAVADCTGHGVPGAMVSVICASALNRAVKDDALSDVGEILNRVSDLVESSFDESEEHIQDGMDIALCALDLGRKQLHFTGANNPLWIVSKSDKMESSVALNTHRSDEKEHYFLHEIKGQRRSVGSHDAPEVFNSQLVQLQPGDSIYLFSDGYVDQFGGENGKKFKAARLKKLLLEIADEDMQQQREILDRTITGWQGDLQQIDDICILGVKINGKERLNFTKREIEVLELLREGLPSKLIADKLNISPHTVDTYRRRLLSKTNTHNSTELLQYCKDKEII